MKRIYVVSYDEGHEAFTNARQAVLFVQAFHGLPNLIPNPERRAWVKRAKEHYAATRKALGEERPQPIFGVDAWTRQLRFILANNTTNIRSSPPLICTTRARLGKSFRRDFE